MMTAIGGSAAGALALLVEVELKAFLLLAVAAAGAFALRRSSAAARHLVWAAGVVGALALPALAAWLPPLELRAPVETRWALAPERPEEDVATVRAPATEPRAAAAVTAGTPGTDPRVRAPATAEVPVEPAPRGARVPFAAMILGVWAAGAALLLSALGASMVRLWRLRGRSPRVRSPALLALRSEVARELGLSRPPLLLDAGEGAMPLVGGILRPAVLLPSEAAEWPRARARAVLLHELAHVRRRDLLVQLAAEVVRALHWPNPLAWAAARRLVIERERACDDQVLAAGSRASDYAVALLELARSLRSSPETSRAALAMARPGQLSERVVAVLESRCPRGELRRRSLLLTALGAAALVGPLAAAVPVGQGAAEGPRALPALGGAPEHRAVSIGAADEVSAPDGPATPEAPLAGSAGETGFAAPIVQEPCPVRARDGSVNHNVDDDSHRLTFRNGDCRVEVRIEGELRFTDDFTGIAGISRGGFLRMEERDGGERRYLEVTPDGPGGLSFDWRVNGDARPFDAEGRAWLSEMLLWLFRDMALGAEERVAHILRTGGAGAVLEETGRIRSDWGRAIYLRELMETARLEPAQVRRVVDLAAGMSSDHYRSEVLTAVAKDHPLSPQLAEAFVGAATAMDSDHYRAQVLGMALQSGQLGQAAAARVLEAATAMDSDHYRAEVLSAVAGRYTMDAAMRAAYLQAALDMESDHYLDQALSTLLEGGASEADVGMILQAVRRMESDHYRAQTLERLPTARLIDIDVQRAFVAAAGEMESDHYKAEVLERIVSQRDLAPELLAMVLTTARTIESDHYLAELLTAVAERNTLTEGPLRDAFLRAADEIESSHYYGEVMSALRRRGGRP